MKVLHIITGLEAGGAERSLYNLVRYDQCEDREHIVCSLRGMGKYGPLLQRLGRQVYPATDVFAPYTILMLVRRTRPDIIHGWMPHGNLAALFGSAFSAKPRPRLLWNVRQSLDDLSLEKPTTAFAIKVAAHFSAIPERIIYNSQIGAKQHEGIGFDANKTMILPNGFDTTLFRPNAAARAQIRGELGIDDRQSVIGITSRFHPMKDYENFFRAAKILMARKPKYIFIAVGMGTDDPKLRRLVQTAGLFDRTRILGERDDIPNIMAALDVAVLASRFGEAFPNVVGEAMSCAIPCVVTDVGDAPYIVGDTGLVVPRADAKALANAIESLVEHPDRLKFGIRAREKIERCFSISATIEKYSNLYRQVSAS